MINLFSLIADQVKSRQELFDEEGKIMQALLNVGYPLHQADAAITLMQTLVQKQSENFFGPDQSFHRGVRTMNSEERRRFSADAFAFAVKLTHLGVLSRGPAGRADRESVGPVSRNGSNWDISKPWSHLCCLRGHRNRIRVC